MKGVRHTITNSQNSSLYGKYGNVVWENVTNDLLLAQQNNTNVINITLVILSSTQKPRQTFLM